MRPAQTPAMPLAFSRPRVNQVNGAALIGRLSVKAQQRGAEVRARNMRKFVDA